MKRILTDVLIRKVAAPTKGRAELADTRCAGLAFRVTTRNARSWAFRFRDPQSRRTTYATIGRYPDISLADARKAADGMRKLVAAGTNPVTAKRQEWHDARSRRFQVLADRYIEEHAKRRKRSWRADARNLRLHVLPARTGSDPQPWKDRRYTGIRRSDVIELVEGLIKTGKPVLANRVQALISSIYSFGVDADLIGSHPIARLKKRGVETQGRRVLTDDEIRLFWPAIVEAPVSRRVGVALRLMLLTGVRPGEAAGLPRAELHSLDHAEAAAWVLPSERSKNKREHLIPLGSMARQAVADAMALIQEGDGYLFPSPHYRKHKPITAHALAVAMARCAEKIAGKGSDGWKADPPTPHDLRRTVATRLSSLGVPKEIRDRVLNHTPPGSDVGERHYNLYEYAAEKRRALATWEIALAAILSPSPSVTSIAGAPRGEGASNHGIRSLPTGPGTAPALSPSTAVLQRRDAMRDADNTERPPQSVKATLAPTWRVSAELTQPSLEVRVRNLISDLERAFLPPGKGGSLDVTKSAAAGPLERLRMQYVIGLSQICRFLADAGASLDTINHFGRLGTALADLNSAAVNPLLSPPCFTGRIPDLTDIWQMRGRAAVGLEFLIRSGMKHQDAAKRAAKEAPGLRRLLRSGKRPKDIETPTRPGRDDDLASSMKKWRAALERRARGGDAVGTDMADMIATHTYQSGKALLARYDDASHILRSGVALLKWVEADAMATNLDPDNL